MCILENKTKNYLSKHITGESYRTEKTQKNELEINIKLHINEK